MPRETQSEHQCPECAALEAEEVKLVRQVVDSVCRQHPAVDEISAELRAIAALEGFRDARVRDYLPVLLEREVLSNLVS